ncbi:hypothetical protein LX32DRAFT_639656 [Colletotrichum zoysiae]|uniref:Uncharacterized protein n=1 Tax=Colletotrichum zoysiae TaxID=1216348 RepID=A0AAD9HIV7_9PEZI|nr:hypothetical protein LX32DRAFT_639656 [Colletotrichum zoysiae]
MNWSLISCSCNRTVSSAYDTCPGAYSLAEDFDHVVIDLFESDRHAMLARNRHLLASHILRFLSTLLRPYLARPGAVLPSQIAPVMGYRHCALPTVNRLIIMVVFLPLAWLHEPPAWPAQLALRFLRSPQMRRLFIRCVSLSCPQRNTELPP